MRDAARSIVDRIVATGPAASAYGWTHDDFPVSGIVIAHGRFGGFIKRDPLFLGIVSGHRWGMERGVEIVVMHLKAPADLVSRRTIIRSKRRGSTGHRVDGRLGA